MKYLYSLPCIVHPARSARREYRGTISGLLIDPTERTVAAAKVTVTGPNRARRRKQHRIMPQYTVPSRAGRLLIEVRIVGFKEFIRKGVHLGAMIRWVSMRAWKSAKSPKTVEYHMIFRSSTPRALDRAIDHFEGSGRTPLNGRTLPSWPPWRLAFCRPASPP